MSQYISLQSVFRNSSTGSIRTNKLHVPDKYNSLMQALTGPYADLSLAQYLYNQDGYIITMIELDSHSLLVKFTKKGEELLYRYVSEELAFVVVLGRKEAGKSFFCDKILNLAGIKGNKYGKNMGKGLTVWTTPFVKDYLKIFVLELNDCDYGSEYFDILSVYALLMGSAIIHIRHLKEDYRKGYNSLADLDRCFAKIVRKIAIPDTYRQDSNRKIYMPSIVYNLSRDGQTKPMPIFEVIQSYKSYFLPNALRTDYQGDSNDLAKMSYLNTKCVNEAYIRKVGTIFKEIYSNLQPKRYKQLLFNGNIALKIAHYIYNDINNNRLRNVYTIYQNILEDLYLSAYNYSIVCYHQHFEYYLADEHPKSFDTLLKLFDSASQEVMDQFNDFTLDAELHRKYQEKLVEHFERYEYKIMSVNKAKTALELRDYLDKIEFKNASMLADNIARVKREVPHLDHGSEYVFAEMTIEISKKMDLGIGDLKMKKMQEQLVAKTAYLKVLRSKNEAYIRSKDAASKYVYEINKKMYEVEASIKKGESELNNLKNGQKYNEKNLKAEIVQLEAQKADNNKRMNTLPNSNLETVPAVVSKKQEINKIDLEIAKVELQLKNVYKSMELPTETLPMTKGATNPVPTTAGDQPRKIDTNKYTITLKPKYYNPKTNKTNAKD